MNPHDPMDPNDAADEPTPAERAAFAALRAERMPGRLLEERTVAALREQGLVRPAEPARPRRRAATPWAAAAVAAGLALFTGGVAVGQWSAQRGTREALDRLHADNARQAAVAVERTGEAYLAALKVLAASDDTAQGRAAARAVLHAVADEMVRLSPDDAVASGILASFDRQRRQQDGPPPGTASDSTARVVWF